MDKLSAFFDIIHQDPVLSRVKLIAEPWDLGAQGYQIGNFPVLWSEWNGRYRDTVRRFWLGDRSKVGDLGNRLTGSSDLYDDDGRRPHASVNFITAHDGFTLRDLVSYARKHNEANAQGNADGWDDNASTNFGVEGDTTDAAVLQSRARQQRNFLATLLLSQGVPMLCAGDEIGRTQHGNNNAYVQDNPVSWIDWDLDEPRRALLAFVRSLAALRRAHLSFRRRGFLRGVPSGRSTLKDATWLRPLRDADRDATTAPEMSVDDWERPSRAAVGLLLSGDGLLTSDPYGVAATDDTFLLLLNAESTPTRFRVPALPGVTGGWRIVVDTEHDVPPGPLPGAADKSVSSVPVPGGLVPSALVSSALVSSGRIVEMVPRSVLLLACAFPPPSTAT
jgi:glycogen operon protein